MGIIIHVMYVDKSLAHGKLLTIGSFIYVNNSIIIASASSEGTQEQA